MRSGSLVFAALCAAAQQLSGKVLFEENFLNYSDYAPVVTRDKGLTIGVDGVWKIEGELVCDATRPLDVFASPVAVPDDGRLNVSMRFSLLGKEPSRFALAFIGQDGSRETAEVASEAIAGAAIDPMPGGWHHLGVKVAGRSLEVWYAPDRGKPPACVAKKQLARPPRFFNIACFPGGRFKISDFRATTGEEPLFDFPVRRHFADFRSLSQPLAGALTAKGGESVAIGTDAAQGVRFTFDGNTNRTVSVGFKGRDGKETVWTGTIAALSAGKPDAALEFKRSPLGSQFVRPNMRPFTENSETGARNMVASGYDILREWDSLPPASRHVFTLCAFRRAGGAWELWMDGSLKARLPSDVSALFFRPSAGVKYAVADGGAKYDAQRFLPLDFAANPRAKAMAAGELRGVKSGFGKFGEAPVNVARPIDSADVGICRQGKGNWALEVEEYHGRSPDLGFPMAIHYRVPSVTYVKAHVLFALDPDPSKEAVLTVRLGRYERNGVGGNMMCDTVLDFRRGVPESCRKVGEVAFGGKVAALYSVAVPLKVGRILDCAARENDYLDFEFTGKGWKNFQQLDNSMKPDPNSTSAFNIFGATLERAPYDVVVRETAPGNVFTVDEPGKGMALDVVAAWPGPGSVKWTARNIDGVEAFSGEGRWKASRAGETNAVSVAFGKVPQGWFSLAFDFFGPDGAWLFRHDGALGVMPPAGRLATRRESPYAVWWFNCHGSTGDPAVGGPIMQKTGIRKFSWNSFSKTQPGSRTKTVDQALYDLYDVTGCGNFHVPRRSPSTFDYEKGVFLPQKVWKGEGKERRPIEMSGEEFFVDSIRTSLSKLPADAVPQVLLWHESAPPGFIAEELLGMDVPEGLAYRGAAFDAKYINECHRLLKKHFPGLKLQIGNSTWSAGAVIGPMRAGADPQAYGRIGIETPSQTVVPERMIDTGLQGMQATMDAAEAISGVRPKCNGTWEFVYRTDRDLGIRRQAEWYMRDILISLAHGFELISPGVFFDTSSGYYNGLWGGAGLAWRSPWQYPKPALVAYGVLTKALDGVEFVRQLDTGSTTVYAVEFRRKDGKFATALWASRGDVEFEVTAAAGFFGVGGGGTVVRMLGSEERLPGGTSVVKGGTSPCYLLTDKPLASVRAGARTYPGEGKIAAAAKVAAPLDDAAALTLAPDPALASTHHRFIPYLQPDDTFEISTVEDEEKGRCVELRLPPSATPPKNKYVDRYVTRYTTMRLREPVPLEGEPDVIGVWVKGDSNWGQVRFEIEDAQGEVFKNQSTGGYWCCDIMDWPGNLAVNFDGWAYCHCSLRENALVVEHSPGAVSEQWVSEGGDKKIDYPVKLRAISVGMNRAKLDLIDFKPAANVLRFRDAGGTSAGR